MRRRKHPTPAQRALISGAIIALALSPATPALAAGETRAAPTGSIRITESITHAAYAYQVFAGSVETDGTIADIKWGSGVRGEALLAALARTQSFAGVTSAREVAEKLSVIEYSESAGGWVYISGIPANGNASISRETALAKQFAVIVSQYLDTGHRTQFTGGNQPVASGLEPGWYVVASDYATQPGESAALLFPGLITVSNTQSEVTPKESVPTVTKEIFEDSGDGSWGTYADFEIGQPFKQRLTATIGDSDIDYYDHYYLSFSDVFSTGLELATNPTDIKVKIDGRDKTSLFSISYSNKTLTVTGNDIKSAIHAGSKVEVVYDAVLTKAAVAGSEGNPNAVRLTYSADPRTTENGASDIKTVTPYEATYAYTYKLSLTKSDSKNARLTLPGAKFSLRRSSDGKYAVLQAASGTSTDTSTGNNEGNRDVVVTGWVSKEEASFVTTGQGGVATITGLDAGEEYVLNEVVAPDGYDLDASDISFVIASNATGSTALTGVAISVDSKPYQAGNASTGQVSMGATNVKSPLLPTTGLGGIATSVILGSGLVATAATVVAVQTTRKRKE